MPVVQRADMPICLGLLTCNVPICPSKPALRRLPCTQRTNTNHAAREGTVTNDKQMVDPHTPHSLLAMYCFVFLHSIHLLGRRLLGAASNINAEELGRRRVHA